MASATRTKNGRQPKDQSCHDCWLGDGKGCEPYQATKRCRRNLAPTVYWPPNLPTARAKIAVLVTRLGIGDIPLNLLGQFLRNTAARQRHSMLIALALGLLFVAASIQRAQAQSCVQLNGATYTQNFNTLAVSGSSNVNSLPIGFTFSEAGSGNSTYAASDGSNPTGDTYSFGSGTTVDRALGELTTASVQSTVGACFVNNTGSAIITALVGYTGEQWRLGTTGGPVDRLDFQFSADATGLTNGIWINVDGLDFTTPNNVSQPGTLDGNVAINRQVFAPVALNPVSLIAANATFFIRWLPSNITGANDALAIDDFLLGYVPPPGLSGDFNSNNEVDAADYVAWRKGNQLQNETVSPGSNTAADYTPWRINYGATSAGSGSSLGSGTAVPEPGSALMGLASGLGLICVYICRRVRGK